MELQNVARPRSVARTRQLRDVERPFGRVGSIPSRLERWPVTGAERPVGALALASTGAVERLATRHRAGGGGHEPPPYSAPLAAPAVSTRWSVSIAVVRAESRRERSVRFNRMRASRGDALGAAPYGLGGERRAVVMCVVTDPGRCASSTAPVGLAGRAGFWLRLGAGVERHRHELRVDSDRVVGRFEGSEHLVHEMFARVGGVGKVSGRFEVAGAAVSDGGSQGVRRRGVLNALDYRGKAPRRNSRTPALTASTRGRRCLGNDGLNGLMSAANWCAASSGSGMAIRPTFL